MDFKNLENEFYIGAYHFTGGKNNEYSIYFLGEYHGNIKILSDNLARHYRAYDGKTVTINNMDRFF